MFSATRIDPAPRGQPPPKKVSTVEGRVLKAIDQLAWVPKGWEGEWRPLGLVELSRLNHLDSAELVGAMRGVVIKSREAPNSPLVPRRSVDICFRWTADSRVAELARAAFRLEWERLDRESPGRRLPCGLLTEDMPRLLGHLPPTLASRVDPVLRRRLVAYPHLELPSESRDAKDLGRLVRRFGEYRLLRPSRYATQEDLEELSLDKKVPPQSNLQLWASPTVHAYFSAEKWDAARRRVGPSGGPAVSTTDEGESTEAPPDSQSTPTGEPQTDLFS